MTKLNGPLLSLSASKTLKKTITFQKRPSGHAAYLYTKPGDVSPFIPSATQIVQRDLIGNLVLQWRILPLSYKVSWNQAAKDANYNGTGYHYFIHKGGYNYSDLLKMEDKIEFLKRMHAEVIKEIEKRDK